MNPSTDPAAGAGARHADPRVAGLIALYEQLVPADLDRLADYYAADARFKDPFNEVQGVAPIRAVFAHMFATLHGPRFVVHEAIVQGDRCFLAWDFMFRFRAGDAREQVVRGGSHIVFGADGRVRLHRDYWDAAEELYEKLPLIGTLMRWLKRRAGGH